MKEPLHAPDKSCAQSYQPRRFLALPSSALTILEQLWTKELASA